MTQIPTPPAGHTRPQAARPKTLGMVALIAGIAVFVLSPIASVLIGVTAGPLATVSESGFSFYANTSSPNPAIAILGLLIVVHIGLGTLLGVWSIVQGIVAVATKRGRAYGVVAIVLAAVAPILSFVVYSAAIAATLPPH